MKKLPDFWDDPLSHPDPSRCRKAPTALEVTESILFLDQRKAGAFFKVISGYKAQHCELRWTVTWVVLFYSSEPHILLVWQVDMNLFVFLYLDWFGLTRFDQIAHFTNSISVHCKCLLKPSTNKNHVAFQKYSILNTLHTHSRQSSQFQHVQHYTQLNISWACFNFKGPKPSHNMSAPYYFVDTYIFYDFLPHQMPSMTILWSRKVLSQDDTR